MPEIYTLVCLGAAVGCAAAFMILLMGRTGIRDRVIETAPRLISELFGCDFCLSFWISTIFVIVIAISCGSWEVLAVPLISTPISRILL